MNGPVTVISNTREVLVTATSTPRVYQVGITSLERSTEVVTVTRHMGPTGKDAYEIVVEFGYTGTREQWANLMMGMVYCTEGEKRSALDAGVERQFSITDDYLFVCVTPGQAGQALWKKLPMFKSN